MESTKKLLELTTFHPQPPETPPIFEAKLKAVLINGSACYLTHYKNQGRVRALFSSHGDEGRQRAKSLKHIAKGLSYSDRFPLLLLIMAAFSIDKMKGEIISLAKKFLYPEIINQGIFKSEIPFDEVVTSLKGYIISKIDQEQREAIIEGCYNIIEIIKLIFSMPFNKEICNKFINRITGLTLKDLQGHSSRMIDLVEFYRELKPSEISDARVQAQLRIV